MQGSPLSGSWRSRGAGVRQLRLVYHVSKALKITFIIWHKGTEEGGAGVLKISNKALVA